MLKKVICFLSIVFAIALVAKTTIFILAIMGGAKMDTECINMLVELGISWLVVLVAAVAFIFKLFEAPNTVRVPMPLPFPFPVHDDDDKPEDDDPEKPEGGTEEKPEDDTPESGTEEKPEGTEDKPE
jgi:hypothetical protein